jgi:carbon-monoxide dehydrogenase medium subunit
MGEGDTPLRIPSAEAVLEGNDLGHLAAAIGAVREAVEPGTDLHASADYRRHLVGALAARAIAAAWESAR